MLFSEKQDEVKRIVYHEQAGVQFQVATRRIINRARRLIAKEARWRNMRYVREPVFDTVEELTTGTATFTNASSTVTVAGVDLIVQGIQPQQRIRSTASGASGTVFQIESVDSATQVTINKVYDGTTVTAGAYEVLGRERYTLPVQLSEIAFLWHEDFGDPFVLDRIDERQFFWNNFNRDFTDTPDSYYLVDPSGVERQPSAASAIRILSSSNASSDQSSANVRIIIQGLVSNVPDQESIILNGTTAVDGTKAFSFINRIVKTGTTTGRVIVSDTIPSAGSGSTLATIPANDAFSEPLYERIGLYPIPDKIIPMNLWGYLAPRELVGDDDISEWGVDFDQLEIHLSSAIGLWEERNKEEGDRFFAMYQYELGKLKGRNVDRLDGLPKFKRSGDSLYGVHERNFVHPRLSFGQVGSRFGPIA